jgi:hypothetical protein
MYSASCCGSFTPWERGLLYLIDKTELAEDVCGGGGGDEKNSIPAGNRNPIAQTVACDY